MSIVTLVGQTVSGDPFVGGGVITITTSNTPVMTFIETDGMLDDPQPGEFVSFDGGTTLLSYTLLGYGFVRNDPLQWAAFIRIDNGDGTFQTVAIDMNRDGDNAPSLTNGNTKLLVTDLDPDVSEPFPVPLVPCFTPGTVIATESGPREMRDLRIGDRVLTRDNGFQRIRWIGCRRLSRETIAMNPELAPVIIRANAFSQTIPDQTLVVSPQHRLLINSPELDLMCGASEALLPASCMTHLPGVTQRFDMPVTYMHMLFDRHEIVLSNGIWTESFQPSRRMVSKFDIKTRNEVVSLFPELARNDRAETAFESARPTLGRFEFQALGRGRGQSSLAA